MSTSDTMSLVVALVANGLGILVLARTWARSRRGRSVERTRHPSVRPPVSVGLVGHQPDHRLCVGVAASAPATVIDIVSYRRAQPPSRWESESLLSPVVLEPGGRVEVGPKVPTGIALDVVVAWTTRHPTGEVQGSRLFRLPPEREATAGGRPRAGLLPGWAALAVAALVVGAAAVVAASWLDRDDLPADDAAVGGTSAAPTVATTSGSDPTTPATDAPTTTAPTIPTTTIPATTPPASTTPPSSTTPSSSSSPPATADTPDGTPDRSVVVEARVAPCRFGEECLVVGFALDGFTGDAPQEYVCEFEDGSRFTFRFDSAEVVDACATGSPDATITIEVDGVRSETVSRADAA